MQFINTFSYYINMIGAVTISTLLLMVGILYYLIKVKKITANSGMSRHGTMVWDGTMASEKENVKTFAISLTDEKQVRYDSYFKDAVFEIHIPYWTDSKGVKHYLKYDEASQDVIMHFLFRHNRHQKYLFLQRLLYLNYY